MEKRVYQGRTRTAQVYDDRSTRAGEAYQTEQKWSPDVFNDDMPPRIQLQYLKVFALTLRETCAETAQDIRRIEKAIEKIGRRGIDK